MAKRNVLRILASVLAVVMILSLSATVVFADSTEPVDSNEEPVASETAGNAEDTGDPEDSAAATDTTGTSDTTDADSKTTTAAGTNSSNSSSSSSTKKHYGIATLFILALCLVIAAIFIFRNKERAVKLWRSFKSEFKKVVWADKHQTTKNTILVIIAIVVFAAVIGLVDYLLSLGIINLGKVI